MYTLAIFHCAELMRDDSKADAMVFQQSTNEWKPMTITIDKSKVDRFDNTQEYAWFGPCVVTCPIENIDMTAGEMAALLNDVWGWKCDICSNLMLTMEKNGTEDEFAKLLGYKDASAAWRAVPEMYQTRSTAGTLVHNTQHLLPLVIM